MSPVVLKAMKKGNLKSFVSGERSRALWALLFVSPCCKISKDVGLALTKCWLTRISVCAGSGWMSMWTTSGTQGSTPRPSSPSCPTWPPSRSAAPTPTRVSWPPIVQQDEVCQFLAKVCFLFFSYQLDIKQTKTFTRFNLLFMPIVYESF